MSNVWPKKWLLTREFLKQYLTEKQNGYLQSGHLWEVVAMRQLTVIDSTWFVLQADGFLPLFPTHSGKQVAQPGKAA